MLVKETTSGEISAKRQSVLPELRERSKMHQDNDLSSIAIIIGSLRKGSFSRKIARRAQTRRNSGVAGDNSN